MEGTKIGGAPRWPQSDLGLPGIFVASLDSFTWLSGVTYPFVNDRSPSEDVLDNVLCLGDMASVFVYWTGDSFVWDLQF